MEGESDIRCREVLLNRREVYDVERNSTAIIDDKFYV